MIEFLWILQNILFISILLTAQFFHWLFLCFVSNSLHVYQSQATDWNDMQTTDFKLFLSLLLNSFESYFLNFTGIKYYLFHEKNTVEVC